MENLFFDGWPPLLRTTITGILAYVCLIAFLRIAGKRLLSKMNAFDLVITVSLGSTLASILLNKDVTLAQGVLALAILVGLQFLITWSSIRARWIRRLVSGEPSLLLHRGEFLRVAMRRERVTEDEVRAAIRAAGLHAVEKAEAVVLETDGSLSVVRSGGEIATSSLDEIKVPKPRA